MSKIRDGFIINGFYYEKKGYKFRKFLNIKKNDSAKLIPDIMVVMMNPGSSKPIDGIENNNVESLAIPDNTQDQIMRVMLKCDFEFARVLNLSDLREAKSSIFYSKLEELKQKGIAHSIFDNKRKKDFDKLFVKNVPVIYAWGVGKDLFELAEMTINKIENLNPIGLNKDGFEFAYYHPLPQNYHKQKEWLEKIIKMIGLRKDMSA